jgi:dTDP-4-amino-4,6-dideoxygalactose transaminase
MISDFSTYRGLPSAARSNLPNATDISNRVLRLLIYPSVVAADQEKIIDVLL